MIASDPNLSRDIHMAGMFAGNQLVIFSTVDATNPAHTEFEKLAVIPSYRHTGAGKLLVDWAAHTAHSLGAETLSIGIIEENARLCAWYASLSFLHTETHRFNHLPFTVGFMQLPLSAYFPN